MSIYYTWEQITLSCILSDQIYFGRVQLAYTQQDCMIDASWVLYLLKNDYTHSCSSEYCEQLKSFPFITPGQMRELLLETSWSCGPIRWILARTHLFSVESNQQMARQSLWIWQRRPTPVALSGIALIWKEQCQNLDFVDSAVVLIVKQSWF